MTSFGVELEIYIFYFNIGGNKCYRETSSLVDAEQLLYLEELDLETSDVEDETNTAQTGPLLMYLFFAVFLIPPVFKI